MKRLGYYWGMLGVIAILCSAIFRLSARVIEMSSYPLSSLQWSALLLFALYMSYAEGYKGFHRNFAPRVVSRARGFLLRNNTSNFVYILLAPLVCMGFLYSTTKRKTISFLVTTGIIVLVVLVSMSPQPWRGIIDAGVVLGLVLGVISIIYFWIKSIQTDWVSPVPADFPEKNA